MIVDNRRGEGEPAGHVAEDVIANHADMTQPLPDIDGRQGDLGVADGLEGGLDVRLGRLDVCEAARGQQIRLNSEADGHSPDEREREPSVAQPCLWRGCARRARAP